MCLHPRASLHGMPHIEAYASGFDVMNLSGLIDNAIRDGHTTRNNKAHLIAEETRSLIR